MVTKPLIAIIAHMHNFNVKFSKRLGIYKKFAENSVNEPGNVPRRDVVPKFSDLEVIALSAAAKVSALTVMQYVYFVNHRNIGQVKYALM